MLSPEERQKERIKIARENKERLFTASVAAMQGLLAAVGFSRRVRGHDLEAGYMKTFMAEASVSYAKALLAELDKEEGE